jgi:hypothetical protein
MSEGSFSGGSFGDEIAEHLELKRRNSHLDHMMPLERYRDDPAPTPGLLGEDPPTGSVSSNGFLARDPDSWWNARDGASPEFDWNG